MCLLALAAVVWAVCWPLPHPAHLALDTLDRASSQVVIGMNPEEPLAGRELWSRKLRARDAVIPASELSSVKTPVESSAADQTQPSISLLGTMVEPGLSYAMFSDEAGNVDTQAVGGLLQLQPAGIRLMRVESGRVEVSFAGRVQILTLAEKQLEGTTPEMSGGSGLTHDDDVEYDAAEDAVPEFESLEDELDYLNGTPPEPGGSQSQDQRASDQ